MQELSLVAIVICVMIGFYTLVALGVGTGVLLYVRSKPKKVRPNKRSHQKSTSKSQNPTPNCFHVGSIDNSHRRHITNIKKVLGNGNSNAVGNGNSNTVGNGNYDNIQKNNDNNNGNSGKNLNNKSKAMEKSDAVGNGNSNTVGNYDNIQKNNDNNNGNSGKNFNNKSKAMEKSDEELLQSNLPQPFYFSITTKVTEVPITEEECEQDVPQEDCEAEFEKKECAQDMPQEKCDVPKMDCEPAPQVEHQQGASQEKSSNIIFLENPQDNVGDTNGNVNDITDINEI